MRPWVWRTWPRWPTWRPTSTPSSGTIRTTSCEENTSNQYRGCLHLWFELSSFLPAQCAQFQTIHREPSDFVSKLMEHPESDVKVIFMINLAVGTGDPRTAAGYLLTWPFSSASPFLGNKMRNVSIVFRYFYHYVCQGTTCSGPSWSWRASSPSPPCSISTSASTRRSSIIDK